MCVAGSNIPAEAYVASQKYEMPMSYMGSIFEILLGSTYFLDGSE